MQRSVVIRADGGHQIGTGHIARTLRLAGCLSKAGSRVTFVSHSLDGCAELIRRHGHRVLLLPPSTQGSSVQTASAICALEPDFIVNDIRDTTREYMEAICQSGARVINFDDNGSGAGLADVLIDANRRPDETCVVVNDRVLFGPDYMVIDEAFEQAHRLPKGIRPQVEEVLVFMGGSDPAGLTLKAIEAIERLAPAWHTTVVIGYLSTYRHEASAFAARCGNVDLLVGADELAPRMQEADLAICSGGIAMFELACVGTPSLVWCQVPHELHNAALLAERGAVRCLGLADEVDLDDVVEALRALSSDVETRRALSEAGKETVDGRGLRRVMEVCEACVQQS